MLAKRSMVRGAGSRPGIFAAALCLAVVGCSGLAASPGPSSAEASDGSYKLTFELARSEWETSDAITGSATLSYSGANVVQLWGSGSGPINFGYAEVGGSKMMGPAWTADCAQKSLSSDKPITSALGRSGGFNGEDPNASFYRSFFTDKEIHLPAGDWTITAVAEFTEGACGGPQHTMRATIQVHVTA